ncbi:MAG: hypothetical protein ACYCVH_15250 [Ignavibacteriaceae bacterium]
MRRIYFTILIAGILIVLAAPLKAQVHFNFNISSQPVWGPVGYDEVQYYYLPDIDTYYYVPQHRFIYQERGRWITSSYLPPRYRNYNLYNGHKVVINEDKPYRHDQDYREKYGSYRDRHDQQSIRDSRDSKYFVNKNHPEHNKWIERQRHDNGHGREQGHGNKHDENNRHDNQDNQDRHGDHKK